MPQQDAPDVTENILARLDEMLFWIRIVSFAPAREHFQRILDSDEKRSAYQLTDGQNTIAAIRQQVPVGQGTLHAWWTEWEAVGIVREAPNRKGRKQKLIDLRMLALE